MNKLIIFVLLTIVASLLLGLSGCGGGGSESTTAETIEPQPDVRGTSVGQLAPDFELVKTDGDSVSLKDLEGNPAMIVFWTAWCPVCKEEAPHVNKIFEEFGPKGLSVVGINIGESDARVNEGIKEFGIMYSVAKDISTAVAKSYKVIGTPTVVILDSKGVVNYFGNEIPKDYRERLEKLIGT